jgi:Methyltransferase FkbM domain
LPKEIGFSQIYVPDLAPKKAAEILSYDYEKERFNAGAEIIHSSNRIALDEFAKQHSLRNIDILKIDTDGHDIEVLIGAQNILGTTILGAKIECFFSGTSKLIRQFIFERR